MHMGVAAHIAVPFSSASHHYNYSPMQRLGSHEVMFENPRVYTIYPAGTPRKRMR